MAARRMEYKERKRWREGRGNNGCGERKRGWNEEERRKKGGLVRWNGGKD